MNKPHVLIYKLGGHILTYGAHPPLVKGGQWRFGMTTTEITEAELPDYIKFLSEQGHEICYPKSGKNAEWFVPYAVALKPGRELKEVLEVAATVMAETIGKMLKGEENVNL